MTLNQIGVTDSGQTNWPLHYMDSLELMMAELAPTILEVLMRTNSMIGQPSCIICSGLGEARLGLANEKRRLKKVKICKNNMNII